MRCGSAKRRNSYPTRLTERTAMPVFDIADPAIPFADLVERAGRGEDIVLARDGAPRARLVPVRSPLRTFTAVCGFQ